MELKVAEDKSWVKREYLRTSRGRNNQKAVVSNILDAIARVKGTAGDAVCETDESGAIRMKILVKKEDLRQVLEAMRDDDDDGKSIIPRQSSPAASISSSLEQRLILLRKRQVMRTTQIKIMRQRSSSWSPALQSIPEEF